MKMDGKRLLRVRQVLPSKLKSMQYSNSQRTGLDAQAFSAVAS